jgi:hypothetical protein
VTGMSKISGIFFKNLKVYQGKPDYLGYADIDGERIVLVGFLRKDKKGKEYIKIKEATGGKK